jgi:hypothetical protein
MLMTSFDAYAQDAMTKVKQTYPVAMQEYGKQMDELKTDYIIAIDVSATMGKHKEEVIPALTRFFDSIGDGNFVRIISFGTMAKEEQTRLEISKQTRPQIISKLNYVYDNVMKDRGMYGHTDFVLLGNKVADLIEKDEDSDIHFLVIFSDIMDDPGTKASGSRHRAVKEWDALRQRFISLDVPVNTLSTYFSHETKDEKQILESIELVNKSFPNFDYSSDINEVLGAKLDGSKFVIYTDKLRQLIARDINEVGKKELFTSQIDKDKSVSLNFDFDNENLKVKKYITGIVVDTCIVTDKSIDIIDIEFDNHKEIEKRSGSKGIGAVVFDKGGIWTENCFAEYTMQYHFLYQQGKDEKAQSFTKDMDALGLLDMLPQQAEFHADGAFVFLWPFWLVVVLCILILVFLFFLVKNTIIPGHIKNKKFICKESLNGKTHEFNANGKRKFILGNAEACKLNDWAIPNANFVIHVCHRNGSPFNLLVKRKIMLTLDKKNSEKAEMRQTIKGKSYALDQANILDGIIIVQAKGIRYEFTIVNY